MFRSTTVYVLSPTVICIGADGPPEDMISCVAAVRRSLRDTGDSRRTWTKRFRSALFSRWIPIYAPSLKSTG